MADSKFMDGVFINKKEFQNGGSVIKMDIMPDRLIAWLQSAPKTEKGYIKTQIQTKREPELDQYGNIKMFCALDDYFYKNAAPSQEQPQNYGGGGTGSGVPQGSNFDIAEDTSDIPFACCAI